MGFINSATINYLGKGLTFPIQLDRGTAVLETDFLLIRSSLRILLGWNYPKRFFLAEYNSRIHELLEEPNDEILAKLLEHLIIDAIDKWEKRVDLISVSFVKSDSKSIDLEIQYKLLNTQQVDSFIYPFYKTIIY